MEITFKKVYNCFYRKIQKDKICGNETTRISLIIAEARGNIHKYTSADLSNFDIKTTNT